MIYLLFDLTGEVKVFHSHPPGRQGQRPSSNQLKEYCRSISKACQSKGNLCSQRNLFKLQDLSSPGRGQICPQAFPWTPGGSDFLKDGKFSRKWYPKQTSIGYRIFYKFSNLRKGIHTKLDFRWAQIALNFLEENYAICSHPPSQIFVVWMKLPGRGKYSSETSGLQE